MAERGGAVAALAARFREGKPLITAWCGIPEPSVAGLLAGEPGFDAVTLDMQHGAYDFDSIARTVGLVAARGKPTIARVPVGGFTTVSRLLDAGISGVIAPMVNTVEDARRFAALAKYPPLGERSWGPTAALMLSGLAPETYLKEANGFSLTLAMIETREALDALDGILAVDGIDGIFLGPSDLSIALSGGAGLDPEGDAVRRALEHAMARARAAGKRVGVYSQSGPRTRELARQGFDLIALASDVALLRAGAQAALREARA
ncbi:4-hydroxy-2-oxo-heptane-1,7-dioate aldolase [Methylobacterium crusticola]|uniref:4-hydroxy-2-oxo-heptane-1,7-dioate aldolase n=1 Tax=Methylobacterium crusticola TaxID=1697972 RepID=A0ABQ4QX26_9HYPH|nr:aldolase/citrate lyase family protein [Methylobacterium crusticola]GJD49191.1 4-hydroxy-2-oxo-heptane-1,7-dioate aldolase [Methylobacterium crusticola]